MLKRVTQILNMKNCNTQFSANPNTENKRDYQSDNTVLACDVKVIYL